MPTPEQALSDPNFWNLKTDEARVEALKQIDPDKYGKLSPEAQQIVIAQKRPPRAQVPPNIKAPLPTELQPGSPSQTSTLDKINTARDTTIDVFRPMLAEKAREAMVAAAPVTGGLGDLAIGGTYMAADGILQHLKSKQENQLFASYLNKSYPGVAEPGSLTSTLANTAEQLAGGKLLDPIARGIGNFAKEMRDPGKVVGDIYKLNPTWSQYMKDFFPQGSTEQRAAQWIEDTLAPGAKRAAIKNSMTRGYNVLKQKFLPSQDLESDASKILDQGYKAQYNTIEDGITKTQSITKLHAADNPHPVAAGIDNNGNTIMDNRAGPIKLDNTRKVIGDYEQTNAGAVTKPDPIITTQNDMIKQKYDPINIKNPNPQPIGVRNPATGQMQTNPNRVISTGDRPLSFDAASTLKTKTEQDLLSATKGTPAYEYYKNLDDALGKDIEKSIATDWNPNTRSQALAAYHDQQFLKDAKMTIFQNNGFDKMMNNPTVNPSTALNKMLDNQQMVKNMIESHKLVLPSGSGNVVLNSADMKESLRAYRLSQLMKDNTVLNGRGEVESMNSTNLVDQWRKLGSTEAHKELFNAREQADIDRLFSTIATSQEGNPLKYGSKPGLTKVGAVASGITLASYLLGVKPTTGIAAVKLGGWALAKTLIGKDSARLLAAAAKGDPLGMSGQAFANLITNSIIGATVATYDQAGKEGKAKVTKDGIIPVGPNDEDQ